MKLRLGDQRRYDNLKKRNAQWRKRSWAFPLLALLFGYQAYHSFSGYTAFLRSATIDPNLLTKFVFYAYATGALFLLWLIVWLFSYLYYRREKEILEFLEQVMNREGNNTA